MTEWLTIEEVGRIIRSEDSRTVKKFIRKNNIRVWKPLGKILISKDDLEFVMEQGTVTLFRA